MKDYPWLTSTYSKICRRAADQGLHHALLVTGQQGIGKQVFCTEVAKTLLCKSDQLAWCGDCQSCHLFAAQSHPDFYQIESDKQIGVDLIRTAIEKLNGMAQLSGNTVLIISKADSMTESAANALLKTLEEPTGNTFLLLETANPEKLLPTIMSRCEKVALANPDILTCQQWLADKGFDDLPEQYLRLFNFAPLRILQELNSDNALSFDEFSTRVSQLASGHASSAEVAEKWQTEAAKIVLWLQDYVKQLIVKVPQNDTAWDLYRDCLAAGVALNNPGINRILLLSSLFSQLPNLIQLHATE